jgi:hypothetical protein
MNTYEPHHPHYSHLETITRFHNAVLDATEQYFINQDEGIYNTENITIIVHGQVFTFDLYPELVEIYNAANTPQNKLDEKVRAQAAMDMEKYMIENGVSIPVIYNSTYQMIADRVILAVDEYDDKIGWGWNFIDIVQ